MKTTSHFLLSIVLSGSLLLQGCAEINSGNAVESYQLWAGQKPDSGVKVFHGKYWQSSHWSKEYIVFLELSPTLSWQKEFIRTNELVEKPMAIFLLFDRPSWFIIEKQDRLFKKKEDNGSLYYIDPKTGHLFIYEIQL